MHLSRRVAASRVEVVALEEAHIYLKPLAQAHPKQLPPSVNNSTIHVHGLVLTGAEFVLSRAVLADPQMGSINSWKLPVMVCHACHHHLFLCLVLHSGPLVI